MRADRPLLLVVANSARVIAESAVRGGFAVWAVDAFSDLDTRQCAACWRVPLRGAALDPQAVRARIGRLIRRAEAEDRPLTGIVYGAGLESHPELLSWLSRSLPLLGNAPEVLDRLCDTRRWFGLLDQLGIPYPEARLTPPETADGTGWLLKETASSGGLGVSVWRTGRVRPDVPHYFQRRLTGLSMSVLFIADGRSGQVIGFNRLMAADVCGKRPFLYGGAVSALVLDARVRRTIQGYLDALVPNLGLRGINGLDLILDGDRPVLIELNPRPTATLALYEAACPGGWIAHHVRACQGRLPDAMPDPSTGVTGHRILYAWRDLRVPDAARWPDWTHDRPPPGTWVPESTPFCSLTAEGRSQGRVETRLSERARAIRGRVDGEALRSHPTQEPACPTPA